MDTKTIDGVMELAQAMCDVERAQERAKKTEFTKRMYLFNVWFVTIIVALCFILMFLSAAVEHIDTAPIAYIIPSAFGELGLHTAFVIWKAKCENIHKYPDVIKVMKESEHL